MRRDFAPIAIAGPHQVFRIETIHRSWCNTWYILSLRFVGPYQIWTYVWVLCQHYSAGFASLVLLTTYAGFGLRLFVFRKYPKIKHEE